MKTLALLLTLSSALLLSGCNTLQPPAKQETASPPEPVLQLKYENALPAPAGAFPADTLYDLLVAELAIHRDQPELSLNNYMSQARKTRDLGVIRRALGLAQHLKDGGAIQEAANLWSELEPENPRPLQAAIMALLNLEQHDKALPLLEKVLLLEDNGTLTHIANQAERLSPPLRNDLLSLLQRVSEKRPNDALLMVTQGLLLKQEERPEEALQQAQRALEHAPSMRQAILLEAEMQQQLGQTDTALGHLREALEEQDDKQMRLLYTRLLFEKQQIRQGMQQAEQLLEDNPEDNYLLYFLAVLMLEHNQLDRSQPLFEELLSRVQSSTPHYYLGRIAMQRELRATALEHFLQVRDGPTLLASYNQIAELMTTDEDLARLQAIFHSARTRHSEHSASLYTLEAGWLLDRELNQQALSLFNEALSQHPDDIRLRYARAMLGEQLGDLQLLERDLRHVLDLEPDNAMALNALGYTLTDHTDRHQEALLLIEKALSLKPDDPAILDSMGWVYFNLGRYDEALEYLSRAYASFPDAEIATHLGKVYWVQGDTKRALEIWRQALDRDPDSDLLREALRDAQGDI